MKRLDLSRIGLAREAIGVAIAVVRFFTIAEAGYAAAIDMSR